MANLRADQVAALRALDTGEPVAMSQIMHATGLAHFRLTHTMQDLLTRAEYAQSAPPGARWELTAAGRAKLAELGEWT